MPTSAGLTTRPKTAAPQPKLPPDYPAIAAAAAKRAAKAAAIAKGVSNIPGAASAKLPETIVVYQPAVALNFYAPADLIFWIAVFLTATCMIMAFIFTYMGRRAPSIPANPPLLDRATDLATDEGFVLVDDGVAPSDAKCNAPDEITAETTYANIHTTLHSATSDFVTISRPMQLWVRAFFKIMLRCKIARWWGITGTRLKTDKRRGIIDNYRKRTWALTGHWLQAHPDPRKGWIMPNEL